MVQSVHLTFKDSIRSTSVEGDNGPFASIRQPYTFRRHKNRYYDTIHKFNGIFDAHCQKLRFPKKSNASY
jgi:hypothetical protein